MLPCQDIFLEVVGLKHNVKGCLGKKISAEACNKLEII